MLMFSPKVTFFILRHVHNTTPNRSNLLSAWALLQQHQNSVLDNRLIRVSLSPNYSPAIGAASAYDAYKRQLEGQRN